jgi:hypothetical protein
MTKHTPATPLPEQAYWDWHNSEPLADCCVDAENVPQGPRYWERMLEAGKAAVADRRDEFNIREEALLRELGEE